MTHDQEKALSLSDRVVVMNAGQIEQIGTPFEIYNFPTTLFVASFIGQLNILKTAVAYSAERACRLDGFTLVTEQPIQASNGAELRLALRPEELSLGYADGNNHLSGQVESVTFLGAIVRMRLSVGSQVISVDRFNERQFIPPQIGEQVEINFPPRACWIMQ